MPRVRLAREPLEPSARYALSLSTPSFLLHTSSLPSSMRTPSLPLCGHPPFLPSSMRTPSLPPSLRAEAAAHLHLLLTIWLDRLSSRTQLESLSSHIVSAAGPSLPLCGLPPFLPPSGPSVRTPSLDAAAHLHFLLTIWLDRLSSRTQLESLSSDIVSAARPCLPLCGLLPSLCSDSLSQATYKVSVFGCVYASAAYNQARETLEPPLAPGSSRVSQASCISGLTLAVAIQTIMIFWRKMTSPIADNDCFNGGKRQI